MRNLAITLVTALSLVALPAYADRGGNWHGHGGGGHGHGGGGGHYRGGGAPWAGLAVVGALTGLAIVATHHRPVYVDPYPTYPAPVYAPSAGPTYYCQSSAMYYPYTTACPEGWLAVPGRRY